MKCPKCGYHSFEHLDDCKKCSQDLTEHKEKFSLRGFSSGNSSTSSESPTETIHESEDTTSTENSDEAVDFGFDFLDEEEDQVEAAQQSVELGQDHQDINIDRPFEPDSETIPADEQAANVSDDDPDDKSEKGPEFAF